MGALSAARSTCCPQRPPVLAMNGRRCAKSAASGVGVNGYFCETLVTLEGIQRNDRAPVLGGTRLQSESTSTDKNTIQISIGVVQDRKPLDSEFSDMLQRAKSLELRALRAPARIGWVRIRDEDGTFFAPDGPVIELLGRMDKVMRWP
jgi:hypothetical protein